ncbi:MAG: chromosomal replication initiator protein DnaA [Patescibacteria group bacterium]
MTNEQVWKAVLGELELSISKANFTTWFAKTFIVSTDNDEAVIGVPNAFTKAWLENKYHKEILTALKRVSSLPIRALIYRVEAGRQLVSKPADLTTAPEKELEEPNSSVSDVVGLNPNYTFSSFIVGKSSELAYAACEAITKKPGVTYNPLFIYGGTGLGKTHLMHAIGHYHHQLYKKKNVIYVTCERFTNDFIQSVASGKPHSFKQRYRSADMLLIDDIQFLAGKEGTQEEFFHTFNALHQSSKQIVMSSDRPPKSIPSLENRLVSRFEWGMLVDINKPDLETRRAILAAKCREKDCIIDDEVLNFIAGSIQSNIRELEGALNRVIAHQQLNKADITLDGVRELLDSVINQPQKAVMTPNQLIDTVAQFYDISQKDICGSSRRKELVVPRQIAMYLIREELKSSYPNIGQVLGGRDHTTAMHAYTKISKVLTTDGKVRQDVELIRQRMQAN